MISLKLLLLLTLLLHLTTTQTITTTLGKISGTADHWPHANSVTVYRGIPYAKPPVAALRFAPPQPLSPWSGTIDTKEYAADCLATNGGMSWSPKGMSEDCLFLNVFVPRGCQEGEGLPLMVWFYGGGWNMGSASFPVYNGGNVIGSGGKRVVVATVNYRLGPFGYLASDRLRGLSENNSTGNMGILDQRMAMKFLKDNAKAFCADPELITIWGESAGAGSVSNHLIMPGSAGLFNRAIMESGPLAATWIADPLDGAEKQFDMAVQRAGCEKAKDIVSCLQQVDASVLNHNLRPKNTTRFTAYAPTIDGVEIPDAPYRLLEQGKVHHVPILLGSNLNEGTQLIGGGGANLPIGHDLTEQGYITWTESFFGNISSEVLELYPASDYKSPWWAVTQIITDEAMTCAARRTVQFFSKTKQPAWLYTFQHEVDVAKVDPYLGVFHGDDLIFTWFLRWFYPTWKLELGLPVPPIYLPLTPAEHGLQDTVLDYWYNFALTGNPNHAGQSSPQWPVPGEGSNAMINLNLPVEPLNSWRTKFCDFWDKHGGFR